MLLEPSLHFIVQGSTRDLDSVCIQSLPCPTVLSFTGFLLSLGSLKTLSSDISISTTEWFYLILDTSHHHCVKSFKNEITQLLLFFQCQLTSSFSQFVFSLQLVICNLLPQIYKCYTQMFGPIWSASSPLEGELLYDYFLFSFFKDKNKWHRYIILSYALTCNIGHYGGATVPWYPRELV